MFPLSDQSGPGNDSNEGLFRVPKTSSIAKAFPSDYLVSYTGHLLGEHYPSAGCRRSICQPQPAGQSWKNTDELFKRKIRVNSDNGFVDIK